MKQLLSIIVTLSLCFCSCSSDDSITAEVIQFTYTTNSQIVTQETDNVTFANIEEGDHLVFNYRFTASQDNNIADDEYGERIIFQIDANAQEFNYSDNELASILTFFNQYCFCSNIGSLQIINGSINGQKINGQNWDIDIDISFELNNTTVSKRINGIFKPE